MRYLLGVLLFCLLGNLEAQERPDWVKQRPVSSMHYIGIACVSKSEKDYMQKAKQQALNDLISEIKVNVASTSLLHTLEEYPVDGRSVVLTVTGGAGGSVGWRQDDGVYERAV